MYRMLVESAPATFSLLISSREAASPGSNSVHSHAPVARWQFRTRVFWDRLPSVGHGTVSSKHLGPVLRMGEGTMCDHTAVNHREWKTCGQSATCALDFRRDFECIVL